MVLSGSAVSRASQLPSTGRMCSASSLKGEQMKQLSESVVVWVPWKSYLCKTRLALNIPLWKFTEMQKV